MNTKTITDYLWLVVGCLCLWIGLKALYYVYAFDSPQSLSGLLFVAPFLLL